MTDAITAREWHQTSGLEEWRVIGDGACTFFATSSLAQSAGLVSAIAHITGAEDHKPDIDVRPDGVTVRLLTTDDDYWGMSQRDVDLGRQISQVAHELGLTGDPMAVQGFLVVPGVKATKAVMPFWEAVLDYERRPDSPDEDLVDPHRRNPGFWFEEMDEPRQGGGAIHVAVWIPPEQGEERLAAALGSRWSRRPRCGAQVVDAGRCRRQ